MSLQFRRLPADALSEGAIGDEAIVSLRRQFWFGGTIDSTDIEEILAIDREIRRPGQAWIQFFVEAVSEFLISASNPRGTLSVIQTDWLMARLDRDGRLDSPAKLELLVHLLEKLDAAPARLKAYVLEQVEQGVVSGVGPTRDPDASARATAACITAEECALIRRLIFAPAGFGPAQVSLEEAEMLFRIKDATRHGDNAPTWKTLFVQGVANYLSGWARKTMPTAEQEAAHQRFVNARNLGPGGDLGQSMRRPPAGLLSAGPDGRFGSLQQARTVLAIAGEQPVRATGDTQRRDDALAANATIDPLETALAAFLRENADHRG